MKPAEDNPVHRGGSLRSDVRVEQDHRILDRLRSSQVLLLFLPLVIGKAIVILTVYALDPSASVVQVMGSHWDSNYYEIIALHGYGPSAPLVFSPVYPALIRLVYALVGSAWVSGLLVTNALSFVFPYVLYRSFGFRTALLAEVFPTYLVFTTVAYSDVVALVLLAASIFFLKNRRTIRSSIAVGAALLTFYNLVLLLPSYGVALLRNRRFRNLLFYCIPIMAGGLVLLWFKAETGDYLAYFKLQGPWNSGFGTPLQQAEYLLCPSGQGSFTCQPWAVDGVILTPPYWLVRNLLFAAFYIFGAFYLLRLKTALRFFLFAYCLLAIIPLFFLVGTPSMSVPRLLLPAFPVFAGYSQLIGERRGLLLTYVVTCFSIAAAVSVIQYFAIFA